MIPPGFPYQMAKVLVAHALACGFSSACFSLRGWLSIWPPQRKIKTRKLKRAPLKSIAAT
jgi:hypothetical protein